MSNILEITAELGGRERKLCLTTWGVYLAVTDFGYGCEEIELDRILDRLKEEAGNDSKDAGPEAPPKRRPLTAGQVIRVQYEELWFAVLPYEQISLKDFLMEIHADDSTHLADVWRRVKRRQGDIIEDTESEGGAAADEEVKKKASAS